MILDTQVISAWHDFVSDFQPLQLFVNFIAVLAIREGRNALDGKTCC